MPNPPKYPSSPEFPSRNIDVDYCPLRDQVNDLARRVAMLDGNGLDPSGGAVGRLTTLIEKHDISITGLNNIALQAKGSMLALKVIGAVISVIGAANIGLLIKLLGKLGGP